MWNRLNVHKMFVNIYRNPKTRNWFRHETFIHIFEFKVFSTWGKRNTIFLCWLLSHRQLSTQPTRGARSAQNSSGLAQLWKSTLSFGGRNSTNLLFSNPQIFSPRFRCVTLLTSPGPIPIWDFYFDISEWLILSARAWTPALMFAPN